MIDIRKLKELVKLMVENDLSELDLQDQEETVTIKRGTHAEPAIHLGHAGQTTAAPPPPAPTPQADATQPADNASSDHGLVAVESPMVGTLYLTPNPDSPPFVAAGSSVSKDTTVCLIEAMKVFNEVKAEINGTIERVLVESGTPVEFGQKIFLVKPN